MASGSGFRVQRKEECGVKTPVGSIHEGEEQRDEVDNCDCVDRISKLPDEILFKIISFLAFREAVRTSILSNRWVNVWKSAELVLDFDASKVVPLFKKKFPNNNYSGDELRRYVNDWMIGVVRQLWTNASKVTKVKAEFFLDKGCKSKGDLDTLLEFAISKRVCSLELCLTGVYHPRVYDFSEECFNHMKTPAGISNIKHLKCLRLSYVNVRGEILEHFIANSPLLEELSVENSSPMLVKLMIVGSTSSPLPLKRLELMDCNSLKWLEIDNAPHLTNFVYLLSARDLQLHVKNCVSLVDVTIYPSQLDLAFRDLSSFLGQLTSLTLGEAFLRVGMLRLRDLGALTNLKLLTIKDLLTRKQNIMALFGLMNPLPKLHTLRLLMRPFKDNGMDWFPEEIEVPRAVKVYHESTKVVEIIGFQGCEIECELMEHVLEFFVGLEKIVVEVDRGLTKSYSDAYVRSCHHRRSIPGYKDCKHPSSADGDMVICRYCFHVYCHGCRDELVERAVRVALEFKSRAAPTIEFVVI
ncbi:unnamed protein product [Linum tenue]|uniref:F-box domain-containing protein n=1 Tax=Linum tenue TaxID=586396 RepID=A0AAV0QSG7_9ROSI|nr:unnamed protein product [Linum tenue]